MLGKIQKQTCLLILSALLVRGAGGQGAFQNLDFESVQISTPDQDGFFPFGAVFPGWTGYLGTNQTAQAFYNGFSLGGALISLISPYGPNPAENKYAINSSYTAVLSAGEVITLPSVVLVPAAIAQSSLVPVNAQSLRFSLGFLTYTNGFLVTFNGQSVPFVPLSTGANYTVYGSDISAFAGATGELQFTERPAVQGFAKAYLDEIFFSPEPIPEPSLFGLFTLGGLLLGWRFLIKRP